MEWRRGTSLRPPPHPHRAARTTALSRACAFPEVCAGISPGPGAHTTLSSLHLSLLSSLSPLGRLISGKVIRFKGRGLETKGGGEGKWGRRKGREEGFRRSATNLFPNTHACAPAERAPGASCNKKRGRHTDPRPGGGRGAAATPRHAPRAMLLARFARSARGAGARAGGGGDSEHRTWRAASQFGESRLLARRSQPTCSREFPCFFWGSFSPKGRCTRGRSWSAPSPRLPHPGSRSRCWSSAWPAAQLGPGGGGAGGAKDCASQGKP